MVLDQLVGLLERIFVKEQLQPLSSGDFALRGLARAALFAAALLRSSVSPAQFLEFLLMRHAEFFEI